MCVHRRNTVLLRVSIRHTPCSPRSVVNPIRVCMRHLCYCVATCLHSVHPLLSSISFSVAGVQTTCAHVRFPRNRPLSSSSQCVTAGPDVCKQSTHVRSGQTAVSPSLRVSGFRFQVSGLGSGFRFSAPGSNKRLMLSPFRRAMTCLASNTPPYGDDVSLLQTRPPPPRLLPSKKLRRYKICV